MLVILGDISPFHSTRDTKYAICRVNKPQKDEYRFLNIVILSFSEKNYYENRLLRALKGINRNKLNLKMSRRELESCDIPDN